MIASVFSGWLGTMRWKGFLFLIPRVGDGDVLVKRHDEKLMAIFKDAKDAKAREMIQRYSFRNATLDPILIQGTSSVIYPN